LPNSLKLSVVLSAVDRLSGPLRSVAGEIQNVEKAAARAEQLRNLGERMAKMGAALMGAGAAMGGGLLATVSSWSSLESSLAKVETVITPMAGTTAAAMSRVQAAARAWSQEHTDTAKSFVETTYMMISAGLDEQQAIEGTRTALALATATMGDATNAASLLATVYNNMGDTTKPVAGEMKRLGDVITATQQTFQFANLDELSEGLQRATRDASRHKVPFEQVAVAVGALNNAGLQGQTAGAAFASMIAQMQEASGKLGFTIARTKDGGVDLFGTLRNMERQFGSLSDLGPEMQQKFQDVWGEGALRGVGLLMGNMDKLAPSFAKVTASAGAASKAQAIMERGVGARWQVTKNNLSAVTQQIGEALAPAVVKLLGRVRDVVGAFARFAEAHPNLVRIAAIVAGITAATLLAAGGALLLGSAITLTTAYSLPGLAKLNVGILKLIPSFAGASAGAWSFAAALLANPLTWIGVVAVGAAVLIYKYWKPIAGFFRGLWHGLIEGLGPVMPQLRMLGEVLAMPFRGAIGLIGRLVGWVGRLLKPVEDVGGAAEHLGRRWGLVIGTMLAAVIALPVKLFQAGANLVGSLWQGIESMASKPVEAVAAIAKKIRDFLPFSPAKVGPLRDLNKLKLTETIAQSVTVAPISTAMTRVGAAAMMATAATVVPLHDFPMAAPSAPAAVHGGGGGSSAPIALSYNYTVTVNASGAGGDGEKAASEFKRLLWENRRELDSVIANIVERRSHTAHRGNGLWGE